ncbi:MAG: M28 family peptidase [Planctomycetes bacterium]|nr:M28 family peptidase [Planctomycetota bacterium]
MRVILLLCSAIVASVFAGQQTIAYSDLDSCGHRHASPEDAFSRTASQPALPGALSSTEIAALYSANPRAVQAAVHALDPWIYFDWVDGLTTFSTRYTIAATFPQVTAYLEAEFQALGYQTTLDPFQIQGLTRHNIIAELPGLVTPEHVILVCGHFDSISQDPHNNAPGADDNASGAAAVVELARVLKQFEFDATIRFVCFSGEEQGLVGSEEYVADLIAAGTLNEIKAVINMDMIAYMNDSKMDVLLEGHRNHSKTLIDLLVEMAAQHTDLKTVKSFNPFGSDHMPYIDNGLNAVLTIEEGYWANNHYHKTSDKVPTLSIPLAMEIMKMNIAAAATAAGIHDVGSAGTVTTYGVGLGGANIGQLSSTSIPNIGTAIELDVSGFANSTALTLMVSGAQDGFPEYGGTVLIDLDEVLLNQPFALSGGSATVQVALPASAKFVGRSGYFQCGGYDTTQTEGVALSNGLKIFIGQ